MLTKYLDVAASPAQRRYSAHVDGLDAVPGQVPGGLDGVAGQAERPDEVAPGAGRHDPEHGVRRDRLAAGDHPVDHLVDGPVAADGDQVALAVPQGLPGGLGGVAGMGGPHDTVAEPPSRRMRSTFGSAASTFPRPARGLAMRTSGPKGLLTCILAAIYACGVMSCGFMIPAGSRAALILARTPTPVSPRSVHEIPRLQPPDAVMVGDGAARGGTARAAWSHAARYRASASWSSAPLIRNVKYSDEPDGYRWDRWQPTACACAARASRMPVIQPRHRGPQPGDLHRVHDHPGAERALGPHDLRVGLHGVVAVLPTSAPRTGRPARPMPRCRASPRRPLCFLASSPGSPAGKPAIPTHPPGWPSGPKLSWASVSSYPRSTAAPVSARTACLSALASAAKSGKAEGQPLPARRAGPGRPASPR